MTNNTPPPQDFKPLSFLPLVRSVTEGHLADLRPLLANLKAARSTPHVFDDATIDRVIRVHAETLRFLPYTRCQLDRWETERPSAAERRTIQCIRGEVDETEQVLHEVLALAREISAGTIDKVLGMSDFELALAVLAGTRPGADPSPTHPPPANADPEHLARQIDARIAELEASGLDDMEIFAEMIEHLPSVARLIDTGTLDVLCKHYAGLARYAGIIETAAENLEAALNPSFR